MVWRIRRNQHGYAAETPFAQVQQDFGLCGYPAVGLAIVGSSHEALCHIYQVLALTPAAYEC